MYGVGTYIHDAPARPFSRSPTSMGAQFAQLLLPPTRARIHENRQVKGLAQRRDESSRIQSGIDSLLILTVPVHASLEPPRNQPCTPFCPVLQVRRQWDGKGEEPDEFCPSRLLLSISRSCIHHPVSSGASSRGGASSRSFHSWTSILHGLRDSRWWCQDPLPIMQPRSRAVEAASNTMQVCRR